jgi:hypothetical protein
LHDCGLVDGGLALARGLQRQAHSRIEVVKLVDQHHVGLCENFSRNCREGFAQRQNAGLADPFGPGDFGDRAAGQTNANHEVRQLAQSRMLMMPGETADDLVASRGVFETVRRRNGVGRAAVRNKPDRPHPARRSVALQTGHGDATIRNHRENRVMPRDHGTGFERGFPIALLRYCAGLGNPSQIGWTDNPDHRKIGSLARLQRHFRLFLSSVGQVSASKFWAKQRAAVRRACRGDSSDEPAKLSFSWTLVSIIDFSLPCCI